MRWFWKDLAAMGTGDPLSLLRLPPELADAAVAQWAQALRFAQTAVRLEDSAARSRLEELQREADIKVRSVELREKEWDMAARIRQTALADARAQVSQLLQDLGRERATLQARERRITFLEAENQAQREQLAGLIRLRSRPTQTKAIEKSTARPKKNQSARTNRKKRATRRVVRGRH